ncbi:protein kinase family protein [Bifidobacterium moukalabense]|uniref:protein kinase family protein n=1 Tax=Bifidobacterium moukalabense TaxID=1333651 RepID=UPI0010F4E472|nr:protein kinase family protein [Bifidobacterium moukalabense]
MSLSPQRQLDNYLSQFTEKQVDEKYLRLYDGERRFGRVFAWLHEQYNDAFEFMNYKAPQGAGGHFNADPSRELMEVNDTYSDLLKVASKAGIQIETASGYREAIDSSREWLEPSGGSLIPEGLTPIGVEKYDTVFETEEGGITLAGTNRVPLQLVGEGSYAVVHKFTDPNYDIQFARKRLKKGSSAKEIERFRKEFAVMKRFDFPYILKVYRYDESDDSYTMEYCEHTLKDYISHNNQKMLYWARRKMAMQFLYAMNFLHKREVYHRDLSYRNVLIHTYRDGGAFMVKVSDFGLAKEKDSNLTSTGSVMKGSIKDPALGSFKDFGPANDIYAIGFILNYIFTGKENLIADGSCRSSIIQKCSANNPSERYQTVEDIIREVKSLGPTDNVTA